MAVVDAKQGTSQPNTQNLTTALATNGDSTNTIDTGAGTGPVLYKVTSTVGATPTVTVNIQGSADGTNWFNVPYSTTAAPATAAVAALTITTATTSYYYLLPNYPWRYLKTVRSANTNVTLTEDAWVF